MGSRMVVRYASHVHADFLAADVFGLPRAFVPTACILDVLTLTATPRRLFQIGRNFNAARRRKGSCAGEFPERIVVTLSEAGPVILKVGSSGRRRGLAKRPSKTKTRAVAGALRLGRL